MKGGRSQTYDDGLKETLGKGETTLGALASCISFLLDKLPAYIFLKSHDMTSCCIFLAALAALYLPLSVS